MTSPDQVAIEVRHLSFRYGTVPVLDDVSLRARAGRFTVLLGPNGSGKSTLLRLLARTIEGGTGSIEVLGRPLRELGGAERAGLIGFLPQNHQPVFGLLVEDVVLTGRAAMVSLRPRAQDQSFARAAMAAVGIEHLVGRPYTELSGGERHMVLLARVLAQRPRVLLLDEPFAHLDLANQVRLLEILARQAAQGVTIVAVIHDPSLAFQHGDDFLFLRNGKIVPVPADTLPWDPSVLRNVYGARVHVVPFEDRAIVVPRLEHPSCAEVTTP